MLTVSTRITLSAPLISFFSPDDHLSALLHDVRDMIAADIAIAVNKIVLFIMFHFSVAETVSDSNCRYESYYAGDVEQYPAVRGGKAYCRTQVG